MSRPVSAHAVPQAAGLRFAIVVSTYHHEITSRLEAGAREALTLAGVRDAHVERLPVPGAYEIPFAARVAATSGRADGVICLGCLIKGDTPHFDYIASAVANGIMHASQTTAVPMAFGVLTTNTRDEAVERVGPGPDNKGYEAAVAAIQMAVLALQWRRRAVPPGIDA